MTGWGFRGAVSAPAGCASAVRVAPSPRDRPGCRLGGLAFDGFREPGQDGATHQGGGAGQQLAA